MYNDAHESKAVTVEMLVMKLLHSTTDTLLSTKDCHFAVSL